MCFEYWKSPDSRWYWQLRSSNGDILAEGGGYLTKENCLNAIHLVRLAGHAPEANLSSEPVRVRAEDLRRLRVRSAE